MKINNSVWICVALLALAGCGGSAGGDTPEAPPSPRSGVVDATYGAGGVVALPGTPGLSDMVVAPDGSVFITGDAIVKLDPRGVVDASYGSGGRLALQSSSPVLDEAGNLYVISGLEIAKVDPTGRLALDFGVNGRASVDPGWRVSFDVPSRLVRDREGNLYVAASRSTSAGFRLEVVKLDREGHRVTSFGSGGAFGISNGRRLTASAMALDAQGNVYVGGMESTVATGTSSFMMIVKANREGQADPGFGQSGLWADRSCATFRGVLSIAIDSSGPVVVGGECHAFSLSLQVATVRKLDGSGSALAFRDPTYQLFGVGGGQAPLVEAREVDAVLVGANGSIHAAGTRLSGLSCSEVAVAKLGPDGTPVADFGMGGSVGLGSTGVVRAMGRDARGQLYVGVSTYPGCPLNTGSPDFAVYRLGG